MGLVLPWTVITRDSPASSFSIQTVGPDDNVHGTGGTRASSKYDEQMSERLQVRVQHLLY